MPAYPKTENLYTRNKETHRLNLGELRNPEIDSVGKWLVTEKIDGTNIRLVLEPLLTEERHAEVRGRSDAAMLPKNFCDESLGHIIHSKTSLTWHLNELLYELVPELDDPWWGMTIYGEGYGPGIGKNGGRYAPSKRLRIFDVATYRMTYNENDEIVRGSLYWRPWSDVELASEYLGIPTAPLCSKDLSLDEAASVVTAGWLSTVARKENNTELIAEGIIARTDPYLFNWKGERVMFKFKYEDVPND